MPNETNDTKSPIDAKVSMRVEGGRVVLDASYQGRDPATTFMLSMNYPEVEGPLAGSALPVEQQASLAAILRRAQILLPAFVERLFAGAAGNTPAEDYRSAMQRRLADLGTPVAVGSTTERPPAPRTSSSSTTDDAPKGEIPYVHYPRREGSRIAPEAMAKGETDCGRVLQGAGDGKIEQRFQKVSCPDCIANAKARANRPSPPVEAPKDEPS